MKARNCKSGPAELAARVACLLLLVIPTACTPRSGTREAAPPGRGLATPPPVNQVAAGMSEAEVEKILGKPIASQRHPQYTNVDWIFYGQVPPAVKVIYSNGVARSVCIYGDP